MGFIDNVLKAIRSGKVQQVYHNRFRPTFWLYDPDLHFKKANIILYRKLRRKYKKSIAVFKSNYSSLSTKKISENKTIWICWLQGEQQAPEIVKACIQSIRDCFVGYSIVIITEDNFQKYVQFPSFILEKWRAKKILPAHFSDLLRLELLTQFGGIWIDATVFCSVSKQPFYLSQYDFFVFNNLMRGDNTMLAENWFIKAPPHYCLLELTKSLLYEYWKKNDSINHYFLFHLFFTMAIEEYPEEWRKMPKVSSVDPHMMVHYLLLDFNQKDWTYLQETASFHKLTYKIDFQKSRPNDFYHHIINN